MTDSLRISKMFRAAHDKTTWHGQNVSKTLEGISAKEAAAHPIPNSHSIWDYVEHIKNWRVYAVRNILDGQPFEVKLNTELDWTPIEDLSETAWEATLKAFNQSAIELEKAMADFDETKLHEKMYDNKFSWYVLFHGVIQHDIYHSGQIVLLKKMLRFNIDLSS